MKLGEAAAVTEATRAHWPTRSLLLNVTQYLFADTIKKRKYGIFLRCTTSAISVATLPDRTGNSRVIHHAIQIVPIANEK